MRCAAADSNAGYDDIWLQCQTLPGIGGSLTWTVTVGNQDSDAFLWAGSSCAAPSVSSVSASTLKLPTVPPSVATALTIQGQALGPASLSSYSRRSLHVTYGPLSEVDKYDVSQHCSVSRDHEIIVCTTTTKGVGSDMRFVVRVGQQVAATATPDPVLDYQPPSVDNIMCNGDASCLLPTDGNAAIHIHGSSFGPSTDASDTTTVGVRYGPSADNLLYVAKQCGVTREDTIIICSEAAEGVGKSMYYELTVFDQTATFGPGLGYHPPTFSRVELSSGSIGTGLSTVGGENVVIYGSNFGPVGTVPLGVTYGLVRT